MREVALEHLVCPRCHASLTISSIKKRRGEILEEAELMCEGCKAA